MIPREERRSPERCGGRGDQHDPHPERIEDPRHDERRRAHEIRQEHERLRTPWSFRRVDSEEWIERGHQEPRRHDEVEPGADRATVLQVGNIVSEGSGADLLQDPVIRKAYLGAND